MSDVKTSSEWISDWPAGKPIYVDYVDVPADGGEWKKGLRPHLEYRDLGLSEATGGKLAAQHIRTVGKAGEMKNGWHCHDLDFQFFYVLNGWMKLRNQDDEEVTFRAGSTGYQPPFYWHDEYEFSEDYELIEITAPSKVGTIQGRETPLPPRAAALEENRKPVYTHDSDDAYVLGAGPRKFFEYRDFGTDEPTDGRIHIHAIRATGEPGEGTGWHYHSMAQWFFILGGSAGIRHMDKQRRTLEPGDGMGYGYGTENIHNVAPYSGDYHLIELCTPADYETIPTDAPAGADD
jgi:quercetin dioxygenase-like cupin family protein